MPDPNPWGSCPPSDLTEAVYQTVGGASICWENLSGAGIFQDEKARDVAERLLQFIRDRMDHDNLAVVFKEAWHQADRLGREGSRVDEGITAVLNEILGVSSKDPDQLVLF